LRGRIVILLTQVQILFVTCLLFLSHEESLTLAYGLEGEQLGYMF